MPEWKDELRRRLQHLELPPPREAEMIDEMAEHLEDRYCELLGQGLGDAAARVAALEEVTERELLATELPRVLGRSQPDVDPPGVASRGALAALWHDVRYALRSLRAQPGFTIIAVLTLAVGIGACTTIFSAVNGVLLRELPFRATDRLVAFWGSAPEKGLPHVDLPAGLFLLYRSQSRTMEAIAAYERAGLNLTGMGDPERVEGASATLDFFGVLGVSPILGRTFAAGEDAKGAPRVVVLSHAFWQRRFGGDRDVVGKKVDLNGNPATVIGVMPPGFDFPERSALWIPMHMDPERFNCWCYSAIGRLAVGRTPDDARREIAAITDAFAARRRDIFPQPTPGGAKVIAMPLATELVGKVRTPLLVLLGAVGCVLLIACANIANLVLARATSRTREMAVRCCLGASPRRIAAQLLVESFVLCFAGAASGVMLAFWGVAALRRLPADQIPRIDEVTVDLRVLLFAIGLAVLTAALCGLAPAWRASRVDLQDAMKSGTRASAAHGSRRVSDAFVVAQFALSLVLLAGAGLLLRSHRRLLAIDPGFRAENTLTVRVALPYPRYGTDTVVRAFYGALLDRVGAMPGVRALGLASLIPLSAGNPQDNIIAEGREPRPGDPVLVANIRVVTPGYFAAMGTPLLRGRDVQPSDDERAPHVVVVDETLARHYWPNEDAVGKRIRHGGEDTWATIVGVVRNVKHHSLQETADLQMYEPFPQRTTWANYLVVRVASSPAGLVSQIREATRSLDPSLPIYDVHTMRDALDRSLRTRRLTDRSLAAFAATALFLAAIGIYGVVSLSVGARVREFGIRLALGARGGDVRGLVLRQGMTLAVVGVVLGLAGALYLTRYLRGLLFGIDPVDLPTFGAVAMLLAATALLACYLPARRATRADPILALRAE